MNKKTPLMLDSTVLKQVPKLNSQLFKELIRYSHIGIFKLYVSEVVEKEYLTWIKEEVQQAYDSVVKATESLNKYHEEPKLFGIKLSFNMAANVAHNQVSEVLKKAVNNWEEFKKTADLTVLPIANSHGSFVMASYFIGEIPFKSTKNRADIPDGFIYCSIVDLLEKYERVLFVSRDKSLVKRINSDQIVCFENLAELFSSDNYKIDDDFFQKLKDDDRAISLFKCFSGEVERKAIREIELSDVVSNVEEELIDDIVGEYMDISSSVQSVLFDITNIKLISGFSYLVPFSAQIVHSVSSESDRDELLFFSKERINNLEKNTNDDGRIEITELFTNKVQGDLSVNFEDSNPLLWKEKKAVDILSESEIEEIIISLEDIQLIA
jgi:hypothetical protein